MTFRSLTSTVGLDHYTANAEDSYENYMTPHYSVNIY